MKHIMDYYHISAWWYNSSVGFSQSDSSNHSYWSSSPVRLNVILTVSLCSAFNPNLPGWYIYGNDSVFCNYLL